MFDFIAAKTTHGVWFKTTGLINMEIYPKPKPAAANFDTTLPF